MKNVALMAAFALLSLAVPASAAQISTAAPVTTLEQQTKGPVSPRYNAPMVHRSTLPSCASVTSTWPDVSAATSIAVLLGRAGHIVYDCRIHQSLYRCLQRSVELHLFLLLLKPLLVHPALEL